MPNLRTLVTLPIAAAAAVALSAPAASAAPAAPASAASAAALVTPSPLLDIPLSGTCPLPQKSVLGMQWINWMWAPLTLDYANGEALPALLVPRTMRLTGDGLEDGLRARHDLVPGHLYTAPGPQPTGQISCTFEGATTAGPLYVTVTGVVVPVSKRIDALLPPVPRPPAPPKV